MTNKEFSYYEAMRQDALEQLRKSMNQEKTEVEHFQIQLYKGDRCYTLGTAYDSMVEAANTMMTWAEAINADKGHVINDLTGEIVIYF